MDYETFWILGRYYNEFENITYRAIIVPTKEEINKEHLTVNNLRYRIMYNSTSEIEKDYNVSLLDNNVIQISKNANGTNQKPINIQIKNAVNEAIENLIFSSFFYKYEKKWFLGSYKDDKGDSIYVFFISNPYKDPMDLSDIYNDKNIL